MPLSKRAFAEFFGTFWLVFGGCGSAVLAAAFPSFIPGVNFNIGFVGVSLAFGLTVLTMAFAIGHISGCHLNPALTTRQAAVGRVQLTRLKGIVEERRRIAQYYIDGLRAIPGVKAPSEPAFARTNWQSFCVELDAEFDQRAVMQHMLDAGVSTRRGVMNSHLERPYQSAAYRDRLPRSERDVATDGRPSSNVSMVFNCTPVPARLISGTTRPLCTNAIASGTRPTNLTPGCGDRRSAGMLPAMAIVKS